MPISTTRLLSLAVGLCSILSGTSAWPSVSCTLTATGDLSANATVASSDSITSLTAVKTSSAMQLSCTGSAEETFANMQTCSQYAALNSTSAYPFTLEREDGRTVSGSSDNRVAIYPLTNSYSRVESAGTWAGNIAGTAISSGSGSGTTSIPLAFDIQAPSGAQVESGTYSGTLTYSVKLVSLSGTAADDDCSGTYDYDQVIATATTQLSIVVPEQCSMTQPGTLDFAQHSTLANGVSGVTSSFSVTCNNNQDKFHVYLDEGLYATSGQRRLKHADTEDYVPYNLLDANGNVFSTAAVSTPESSGGYTRSTSGTRVTINGEIPAITDEMPTGSYSDQVTVYVEY